MLVKRSTYVREKFSNMRNWWDAINEASHQKLEVPRLASDDWSQLPHAGIASREGAGYVGFDSQV
jgi:hypothetical protein